MAVTVPTWSGSVIATFTCVTSHCRLLAALARGIRYMRAPNMRR
jgi:hypothetical protein